jgi:hypothetical protein
MLNCTKDIWHENDRPDPLPEPWTPWDTDPEEIAWEMCRIHWSRYNHFGYVSEWISLKREDVTDQEIPVNKIFIADSLIN